MSFGEKKAHPGYMGIGVDEDTALAVENESRIQVVGDSQVALVKPLPGGDFRLSLLAPGRVSPLYR